jgi:hypothetical protein
MTKRFSIASLVFAMIVFNIGLLVALASPSLAHHKSGHDNGGGGGGSGSSVTEDNDSDGVPNEPDPEGDSDNRHPSGKDKHAEGGNSGNQGNSTSNPDNDGHGPERNSCEGSGVGECVDKPGGDGGVDTLDQDGNNGCGNDDDFEDDNEGWCGKPNKDTPEEPKEPEEPCVDDTTTPEDECNPSDDEPEDDADDVLPGVLTRPDGDDDVRGKRLDRPAVGAGSLDDPETRPGAAILPFTGGDAARMMLLAAGLILGGSTLVRMRKHFTTK